MACIIIESNTNVVYNRFHSYTFLMEYIFDRAIDINCHVTIRVSKTHDVFAKHMRTQRYRKICGEVSLH